VHSIVGDGESVKLTFADMGHEAAISADGPVLMPHTGRHVVATIFGQFGAKKSKLASSKLNEPFVGKLSR
jgi:hypothetical protein